jgi:hypothetical protein
MSYPILIGNYIGVSAGAERDDAWCSAVPINVALSKGPFAAPLACFKWFALGCRYEQCVIIPDAADQVMLL